MSRTSLYNRFSQDVRDAILRSREEAMRLGCPHIDTHHIFLAMLHAADNPALHILHALSVDRSALRNALVERYRLGPRVDVPGNMPLTVVAERP